MDPKVSIIIPAYNAAPYIKGAVDSALAQTYRNVEVMVVDDGSTDETKNILKPYISGGKIKYIYEKNKGLSGARNTGIKESSGEYVALLDADDIFMPEKAEEQVKILEANKSYDVCYSDLLHFDDSGRFYHHRHDHPSGNIFEHLFYKQSINPLAVMARRKLFDRLGYFDEDLHRSEDWDLWLRWAHAGVKFYYLDKPLAKYRIQNKNNLTGSGSEPKMKENNLFIFERLGKQLSEKEKEKYRLEYTLKVLRLKLIVAYLVAGNKKEALARARKSSFLWWAVVSVLPAGAWKMLLAFARRIKHRLLLKRV